MSHHHSGRGLGFVATTCLVVASMVGAGVFTSSGFALASLGSPEWVLVAWTIGAVVAICGAVSYGALVRDLCESGGEYLFLSRRVHPLAGFLAGWVSLVAGFTGAIAVAATSFAEYMVPLVADASLQPQTLAAIKTTIAVAVVALCTVQHCVGLHSGARWQTVVVLGKVLMLVLLVVVGLTLMAGQDAPASNAKIVAPNLGVLASSLTWMALAFSGFNAAIYVASEVDNAPRTVPRAMLTGTLVVAGLYLALNYVFVFAGPIESLAGKPDIAAQSFALLGSDRWAMVCRAVVAVALLTSVSANLMAGPRVYDRMAADGLFPLRAIPPGGVPRLAIVVQALLAAVVIAFSSLRQQLDYLGVLLSLSAALTVGSLFWRRGDRDLPLTPLVAVAAALFTTASLLFACYALVHNFRQLGSVWIAVAATLVSGVVFYFAMRWWRAKSIEPTK